MKKIFLLSLMAIVCQMMQAQEKVLVDSIYYTINNGEASVYGFVPDANGEFRMNIPESIIVDNNNYTVTKIGSSICSHQTGNITSLSIPKTVKTIDHYAFRGNKTVLKADSIVIPESVDTIGVQAFYGSKIKKVTILGNPINDYDYYYSNGSKIFSNSTIEEFYAPNLTALGTQMFYTCTNLKKVYLPKLQRIYERAFELCFNLDFCIPESIEYVAQYAFSFASQSSGKVELPNPFNADYSEYAFTSCVGGIPIIHLTSKVPNIPTTAFKGCKKTTVLELDEGIISIGSYAFHNLQSLKSIMFPSSLTNIDDRAFSRCSVLRNVYALPKNPISLGKGVFGSTEEGNDTFIPSDAKLYVPIGCTEAYKAAGWGEYFSEIIEMDEVSQRAAFAKSVTGVTSIIAPSKTNAGYFNLQGQKLDAPQKGINILRTDDGKARKVYIK